MAKSRSDCLDDSLFYIDNSNTCRVTYGELARDVAAVAAESVPSAHAYRDAPNPKPQTPNPKPQTPCRTLVGGSYSRSAAPENNKFKNDIKNSLLSLPLLARLPLDPRVHPPIPPAKDCRGEEHSTTDQNWRPSSNPTAAGSAKSGSGYHFQQV